MTEDLLASADGVEGGEELGDALTMGDFDGDGFNDLAIGVAQENAGGSADSGAVHIVYGSSAGITAARNELWRQSSPSIAGGCEYEDHFGRALAARPHRRTVFRDGFEG